MCGVHVWSYEQLRNYTNSLGTKHFISSILRHTFSRFGFPEDGMCLTSADGRTAAVLRWLPPTCVCGLSHSY